MYLIEKVNNYLNIVFINFLLYSRKILDSLSRESRLLVNIGLKTYGYSNFPYAMHEKIIGLGTKPSFKLH